MTFSRPPEITVGQAILMTWRHRSFHLNILQLSSQAECITIKLALGEMDFRKQIVD